MSVLSYKIDAHWQLIAFYGHFFAGSYIEDKDDADYAYLELKFNW